MLWAYPMDYGDAATAGQVRGDDQSERLFQAIQGNGGTARVVLLPGEGHGCQARESVVHVLAEQMDWAERWLRPRAYAAGGA